MNITALWDQLVDCICRPPRDDYARDNLIGGPSGVFRLGKTEGRRVDLTLKNKQGLNLQCSHFVRKPTAESPGPWPCVVYCHCNSGSRKDAEEAVYLLLPLGITVFCMDFAGSGLSEGQWVTLGAYEADDLEVIIQHLREQSDTTTIGLWGRSMGAVTCLLYSRRDPSIAGMVLDSPFCKLTDLMMELVSEQKLRIPKAFMKMAVSAMRRSVKKRAKFDINDVAPLDVVVESFIPALFGHADGDTFIKLHHSQRLFEAYAGDKNFVRFAGDHNTRRPEPFYTSVYIFFHNTLSASLASGARPMSRADLCEQACRNLTLHSQQTRHQRRDLAVPWNVSPNDALLDAIARPNGRKCDSGHSTSDGEAAILEEHLVAQLLNLSTGDDSPELVPDMTEEEQLERAIHLSMLDMASNGGSNVLTSGSSLGATPGRSVGRPPWLSPQQHKAGPPTAPPSPEPLTDDEEAMIQAAIRMSLQECSPSTSSHSPSVSHHPSVFPTDQSNGQPESDVASPPSTVSEMDLPLRTGTGGKSKGVTLPGDLLGPGGPIMDSLKAEAEMEALQNSFASTLSGRH